MDNRLAGLLGLARRAGKIIFGLDNLSLKNRHKVKLIIAATDLSDRSKRKLTSFVLHPPLTVIYYGDKKTLGALFATKEIGVFALTEPNLARQVQTLMKEGDPNGPQKEKVLPAQEE